MRDFHNIDFNPSTQQINLRINLMNRKSHPQMGVHVHVHVHKSNLTADFHSTKEGERKHAEKN